MCVPRVVANPTVWLFEEKKQKKREFSTVYSDDWPSSRF